MRARVLLAVQQPELEVGNIVSCGFKVTAKQETTSSFTTPCVHERRVSDEYVP